jgi:hypothetical protein
LEAFNTGIVSVHPAAIEERQKTFCVLGPPRTGTSMVARVLAYLEVSMGVPVPVPTALINYEDPEFVSLLHGRTDVDVDIRALNSAIARRNAEHDLWGFKLPMAIQVLDTLSVTIRNPYFIFVFRDVLSSSMRENLAVDLPLWEGMRRGLEYYGSVVAFVQRTTKPCLLVSYEKAIQDVDRLLESIVAFAGLKPSEDRIQEAIRQVKPNHPEYLERVLVARQELNLPPLSAQPRT